MKKLLVLALIAYAVGAVDNTLIAMGDSTVGQQRQSFTLVGISNQLTNRLKRGGEPAVNILESGGKAVSGAESAISSTKGMAYVTPTNLPLPVKIQVKYADKAYSIIIRDTNERSTCPKFNNKIEAVISGGTAPVTQSICLGKSTGLFFAQDALRWQNLIIVLSENPDYTLESRSEILPFKLGITGWTSMESAWNKTRLTQDPNTGKMYTPGLKVVQGIPAWGGGEVPRPGFPHLAHIYNTSPYILLFERHDKDPMGKNLDFSELMPGSNKAREEIIGGQTLKIQSSGGSVAPYAFAWLPKNKIEQYVSPDSALYIYPFITPENAGLIDPVLLYDPKSAGKGQNDSSEQTKERIDDAVEAIENQIPRETYSLINDELYAMLSSKTVKDFMISKFYYKVYSNTDRSEVRVDKCNIDNQFCENIAIFKQPAISGLVPNFLRLVISENKDTKSKFGTLRFDLTALSQDILKK